MPFGEIGQRVVVDATKHAVPIDLLHQTLSIASFESKSGRFVNLKGPNGVVKDALRHGRPAIFDVEDLLPAPSQVDPSEKPRVVESDVEEKHMSATQTIINLANQISRDEGCLYSVAMKKAGAQLEKETNAYQEQFAARSSEPVSLSSNSTENEVRAELEKVKAERSCSYNEAGQVILCRVGAAKFEQRVKQLRASGLDAVAALKRAQEEDRAGAAHWHASMLL